MSKNDDRILALKAQIDEKKVALAKQRKSFAPVTNCSLEFEGIRTNIQTLTEDELTTLLIKLNAVRLSAEDLQLADKVWFNGYLLADWLKDIKARLATLTIKAQEKDLKRLEDKLSAMLSDGKKTELELDAIADLLK